MNTCFQMHNSLKTIRHELDRVRHGCARRPGDLTAVMSYILDGLSPVNVSVPVIPGQDNHYGVALYTSPQLEPKLHALLVTAVIVDSSRPFYFDYLEYTAPNNLSTDADSPTAASSSITAAVSRSVSVSRS